MMMMVMMMMMMIKLRLSRSYITSTLQFALNCVMQGFISVEARRHLRSASSLSLAARRTRLSTVGDRDVAAARSWSSLPQHVTSSPSVSVS